MNVVGKVACRGDAYEKVTGRALFVVDLKMPGMLHARVLRSEHAHARIMAIHTEDAAAMPGVRKVVTGRECELFYGIAFKDQQPLARDRVRHRGDAVAVVIAETEKEADAALRALRVEYEPLPFVLDPLDAMKDGAPLVQERNGEFVHEDDVQPVKGSNIFDHYTFQKGDPARAFEESDVVLARDFTVPLISHVQLEPHGCVCQWESPGRLKVWSCSQGPFVVRRVLGEMFGLPLNDIEVMVTFLGGGFGGKTDVTVEPLCAYAARFVPGSPVRFVLTRKEMFTSSLLGRGMKGTIRLGAKRDGTLHALESRLYFTCGPYASPSAHIVRAAGNSAAGPYEVRHCEVHSYGIYTNTPPMGPFRGYGIPEVHLMMERMLDILARELSLSPEAIRIRNCLAPGKCTILGYPVTEGNGNLHQCIEEAGKALQEDGQPGNDDEYLHGRGIAAFMKSPSMTVPTSSGAILKWAGDGSVNLSIGGIEMGQGVHVVLAQIAAEALKIPLERVSVVKVVDTQVSPAEWQTVASITTFRAGNAVLLACQRAIAIILGNASHLLARPLEDLVYEGDWITSRSDPALHQPVGPLLVSSIGARGPAAGENLVTEGTFVYNGTIPPGKETGIERRNYHVTFGCQGARVKIHKKTGQVTVTHLVTAIDLGRVINPELARCQVVSSMIMAMGSALQEEIEFDAQGAVKNADLNRYRVPVLMDVPEKLSVIFLETPQEDGPYGARCIGEHPTVGIPPAILNAIHDATGVDFYHIPVKPADILAALEGE